MLADPRDTLFPVPHTVLLPPELFPGSAFAVIVMVPVICKLHEVEVFVASTLYVVEEDNVPVGKLIVPPVPATGAPTLVLPLLFLNW